MAQVIADRRDIDFVLYEQLEAAQLCKYEKYTDFNPKTFGMIINEARNLAVKEILPTFAEGDRQGVRFENGKVRVPDCFHRPFKLFVEGEWTAMTASPDLGGQGLPQLIAFSAMEYLSGANYAFTMYGAECHMAGKMIELFGTKEQKEIFLTKMYAGEWGGTMALTESEAGSDVGALTTTAVKNNDGSYSITGNKIFITNGEHDLMENIIHPVLARIEGAPKGTKGISLFIVPKIRINKDGSLGDSNDVACTGIEEKMGIHGSATCTMAFGSKGQCRGFLLGEENHGMRVMFHMMNEARLSVGAIGFNNASVSYMSAVNYAKERIQGRDLAKALDQDAPGVPIIRHPDVRRMLMWMKAMDLLARKLGIKKGEVFQDFMKEILKIVDRAKEIPDLKPMAEKLEKAVNAMGETAFHMGITAMSPNFKLAFAHALPFLDVTGDLIMAWMLLWRAVTAAPQLEKLLKGLDKEEKTQKILKNKEAAFYQGQFKTAEYFIETILPITMGKIDSIRADSTAILDMPEPSFGG